MIKMKNSFDSYHHPLFLSKLVSSSWSNVSKLLLTKVVRLIPNHSLFQWIIIFFFFGNKLFL